MTEIEFISEEARLLDERQYTNWVSLFTEDARYWAPYKWEAPDPRNSLNIIYDDLPRLRDRVERLVGGDLHAQDPPSHTVRVIGERRAPATSWEPAGGFDSVVCVPFQMAELRREMITSYFGLMTFWLVEEEGWRIRAKKVQLLGAESPLENLTFIL